MAEQRSGPDPRAGHYTVVYKGDPRGCRILNGEPACGTPVTIASGDCHAELRRVEKALASSEERAAAAEARAEVAEKASSDKDSWCAHISSLIADALNDLSAEKRISRRLRRRNARRRERIEHLVSELALAEEDADAARGKMEDLEHAPWPKWADECLKIIRKHSGYDGYDDASDGVDLPTELEETLGEYRQVKRRREVEARVQYETKRHRETADHYRVTVPRLCADLETERRNHVQALAMILFMGLANPRTAARALGAQP